MDWVSVPACEVEADDLREERTEVRAFWRADECFLIMSSIESATEVGLGEGGADEAGESRLELGPP